MSKIIDKLKGLENEELREKDLESIEIIEENKFEKKKSFLKIIIIFLVFFLAVIAGFKISKVFFLPKKNMEISHTKQLELTNKPNIPQKVENKKDDVLNKKEKQFVVFSGGKEFEKYLHKKLSAEPQNPILNNNLAIFYYEQNDINNALKYAQKALILEPDNPYFWNTLGIILTELKLYEDAEKCFKKAIEKKPEEAVFYYNLGNLYERLDRNILARENYLLYLTKSDKINPKMLDFVREKLKKGV